MSVISLGKYLAGGREADHLHVALVDLVQVLIKATAAAAVPYDEARARSFRDDVGVLGDRVRHDTEAESIPVVGEIYKHLVEENARSLERILREQGTELKALARLITRSLPVFVAEDEAAVEKVRELQNDLDSVHTLKDIVEFKKRLTASLDMLQQQTAERRKRNAHTLSELRRELDESRARLEQFSVDPTKDAVTGLPVREDAINVISFLSGKDALAFALVLRIQQLPGLNTKYGHQVGNLILQSYRDHLVARMGDCGRLFRWGGTSLVVLVDKTQITRESGGDLIRSLGSNANLEIDTGTRSMMLPISPRWLAVGRTEVIAPQQIIDKIDRFSNDN